MRISDWSSDVCSSDRTSVSATAASGDLGNGAVTARVLGSGGNVTLTSPTLGALSNGAGSTISYSQIATAVTALGGVPGAAMPHPTLADTRPGPVAPASTAASLHPAATLTFSHAHHNPAAPANHPPPPA